MSFELAIQNVGGIDTLETTFDDGVTLLFGPNASNKTSLLHALAFVLGRDDVPIRSGTSRAEVTLTVGDRSVTRTAERAGTGISISGDSWMTDASEPDALSSFATFLEFNDLRTAVRNGDSFAETLKAPMAVSSLEAKRASKIEEKQRLENDLADLDGVKSELAEVEETLAEKRTEVEAVEAELETLRAERADSEDDGELTALRDQRADLVTERDDQRRRVENSEDAIDRLESRLDEIEHDLEAAKADAEAYDTDELQSEKDRLERRVAEREERVEVLQSVLSANREMLNGEFTSALGRETTLAGDEYTCWACGQSASESAFEETLDDLVELVETDRRQLDEHRPRIEEVASELEAAREADARVRELQSERREVVESLEERRSSLETQRERLQELESELDDLDAEIEAREHERADAEDDLVEEIEAKRARLQEVRSAVSRLEERRERLEADVAEYEEKEEQVAVLSDEIATLTDRIENVERELRESFNQVMEDLVAVLEFERVQRVWLDGDFEVVIAREVDGVVQEESIRHLAESERELIGLVLCLAGCMTYDVPSKVPVLGIDSLGAFDSVRAERLIEYFADKTDHLVIAMHPERASTIDFPVREIESALSV